MRNSKRKLTHCACSCDFVMNCRLKQLFALFFIAMETQLVASNAQGPVIFPSHSDGPLSSPIWTDGGKQYITLPKALFIGKGTSSNNGKQAWLILARNCEKQKQYKLNLNQVNLLKCQRYLKHGVLTRDTGQIYLEFENISFWRKESPNARKKNLSKRGENHQLRPLMKGLWRRVRDSNPGHVGGRRAFSPLPQPCDSPFWRIISCSASQQVKFFTSS